MCDHERLVELLVAAGAKGDIKDNNAETPDDLLSDNLKRKMGKLKV